MNAALVSAIALIVSALVSGLFAWLIKRSADSSATSAVTKELEASGYKRAREAFDDALRLKDEEIRQLKERLARCEGQMAKQEGELESERAERREAIRSAQREMTELRLSLRDSEATVEQLKRIIGAQRRGQLPAVIDLEQAPDVAGSPPQGEGDPDG